jgi:hypothetical protein
LAGNVCIKQLLLLLLLLQVAEWGYTAVAVSCETGLGLEDLAQQLAGKVRSLTLNLNWPV